MPQFRCKHKERIENKEVHPSAWEQMSEAERERLFEVGGEKMLDPLVIEQLHRRKVDIMLICSECGRRKTVTSESSSTTAIL